MVWTISCSQKKGKYSSTVSIEYYNVIQSVSNSTIIDEDFEWLAERFSIISNAQQFMCIFLLNCPIRVNIKFNICDYNSSILGRSEDGQWVVKQAQEEKIGDDKKEFKGQ